MFFFNFLAGDNLQVIVFNMIVVGVPVVVLVLVIAHSSFTIFHGRLLVLYVLSLHDSDTLGLIGASSSRCTAILGLANNLASPSTCDGSSPACSRGSKRGEARGGPTFRRFYNFSTASVVVFMTDSSSTLLISIISPSAVAAECCAASLLISPVSFFISWEDMLLHTSR